MDAKDFEDISLPAPQIDAATPSETLYLQGLDFLKEAYGDGYLNKPLLEKAFECFLNAKKADPNNPDPYVSLAYIYSLLSDKAQTNIHLKQALELEPEHQEALELQLALTQPDLDSVANEAAQAESAPTDWLGQLDYERQRELNELDEREYFDSIAQAPLDFDENDPVAASMFEGRDFDELYDGVESMILQEVHELMETQVQFRATTDPVKAQELYYQRIGLMMKNKMLQFHVNAIDQEIDVSDLKKKLVPLQTLIQRVKIAGEVSDEMLLQQSRIAWASGALIQLSGLLKDIQTREEHDLLERALENLMDEVDMTADGLDAFDKKGYDIKSLEDGYNAVVAAIESFHDALDESPVGVPV